MTTIALVLAAVSALIALICFAALIEMYKSLDEIQKYVEYDDAPKALPETTRAILGRSSGELGLPRRLEGTSFVMLLLSPKCLTCGRLAQRMAPEVPSDVALVVTASDEENAIGWLGSVGIDPEDAILDTDLEIANAFELYTTPAVVRFHNGRALGAWSIASYRALKTVLAQEPPEIALEDTSSLDALGGKNYAAAG
ncbi:MAG: hypothetical protein KDD47_26110 [Acidobacteria bacterium]|nr:hypothetical protein [Acidobacteriota bacterium]